MYSCRVIFLKNTHREKAPSNKTPALPKSMNFGSWQEVHKLKQNRKKEKVVTSKTSSFMIGSFCTPHSVCLNIAF